jgi:acetyl esterase/lipase
MLRALTCIVLMLNLSGASLAATPAPLWPEGAPHQKGDDEQDIPTLTAYPVEGRANTGIGVVVAPGGGYGNLADDHEGIQIARWLNHNGIGAFVLHYRHAPDYGHPVPLLDAQRAVRTVRHNAEAWGIDPGKIGMIGFSAGGHLTATTGTQFDDGDGDAEDPIDRVSSRPDFLFLMYPVITMTDPHTHKGSRRNLLGEERTPELEAAHSAEKNVTENTPPTFIFHTGDDASVPVENAVMFYSALCTAGVPGELHVYEQGRHGVGLAQEDPVLGTWPDLALGWLRTRGILE